MLTLSPLCVSLFLGRFRAFSVSNTSIVLTMAYRMELYQDYHLYLSYLFVSCVLTISVINWIVRVQPF